MRAGTFQAALVTAQRLDTDVQSIDTTTLLAHIAVIAEDVYGFSWCPRCERQTHDVGSCGLCQNTGWLDAAGDPFTFV